MVAEDRLSACRPPPLEHRRHRIRCLLRRGDHVAVPGGLRTQRGEPREPVGVDGPVGAHEREQGRFVEDDPHDARGRTRCRRTDRCGRCRRRVDDRHRSLREENRNHQRHDRHVRDPGTHRVVTYVGADDETREHERHGRVDDPRTRRDPTQEQRHDRPRTDPHERCMDPASRHPGDTHEHDVNAQEQKRRDEEDEEREPHHDRPREMRRGEDGKVLPVDLEKRLCHGHCRESQIGGTSSLPRRHRVLGLVRVIGHGSPR